MSVSSIVTLLVIIEIIVAFIDITKGFRRGDSALIFAGALCGLIALSSSPGVAKPTVGRVIYLILGLVLGVGAYIKDFVRRGWPY